MGFYVCSCLGCPTAQKPTCFLHVPLLFLSRPARLSVRWPQNCFYKCRSHCSIALQPNRITRLFSYSKEVERRERLVLPLLPIMSVPLVQQQRRRHVGHSFFSVLSPFQHLPSSSLFVQTLPNPGAPTHSHLHPWTNIHQWLRLQQMLAALPPNSPYLIWDGHPFCSWVCWRPSLSCPAQHAAADCLSASGVFPLTLGCHGFNQRARLSSAETDAFFSCLSLWFWKECGSVITYCISYLLYLFIKESSAVLCCCHVARAVGRMPGSSGTSHSEVTLIEWGEEWRREWRVPSRCCTTVCDTDGQTHTSAHATCIHYANTHLPHTLMQIPAQAHSFHNEQICIFLPLDAWQ